MEVTYWKDCNTKYYYDKSKGILQKAESSDIISIYSIEFNNVFEEDIEKPQ